MRSGTNGSASGAAREPDAGERAVPAALRWRARRGLLECDLALGAFLDAQAPAGYDGLTAAERAAFAALLERTDADLLPLLLGRAEATDPTERRVVEAIRACSQRAAGLGSAADGGDG